MRIYTRINKHTGRNVMILSLVPPRIHLALSEMGESLFEFNSVQFSFIYKAQQSTQGGLYRIVDPKIISVGHVT